LRRKYKYFGTGMWRSIVNTTTYERNEEDRGQMKIYLINLHFLYLTLRAT